MKKSMSELARLSVEEFKNSSKLPCVVLLDNVRSQHNIGSVFRTSDAFRVSEIILCGITATPPNKEIEKTALGATNSVSWRYFENPTEAIDMLKKDGYTIIGVEQTHNSLKIDKDKWLNANEKVVFVFGNEVFGISEEVLNLCDKTIEIPQYGTKHSLNISVCAGIIIWEMCKYSF
jgi:tRNA G18 (ribose-2'-O)-methylase SpoU